MAAAHPGFRGAQRQIESREGVSSAAAGRILGAGARNASPAAKRRNPRLNRVVKPKPLHQQMAASMLGGGY